MNRLFSAIATIGLALFSTVTLAHKSDFNEQMHTLSQKYFELRPIIASYYGLDDKDAGQGIMEKSSYFDQTTEQARRESVKALIAELRQIDQSKLTDKERISLRLIETEISSAYKPATIVEYGSILGEYGAWFLPYPISHLSGVHVEFPAYMVDKFAVSNDEQAKAYLTRLNDYDDVIDSVISKIEHDRKLGVVPPDFVINKTINNLRLQNEFSPEDHALVTSMVEKLEKATSTNKADYIAATIKAVKTSFYPANEKLIASLEALKPYASHKAGIGHLPNGKALYAAMITHLSDTTLTAEQVHQLGLDEVARITAEMDVLLKNVGYDKGTVGERMTVLLNDPKYLYPNTPEGKAKLIADIKKDLALANEKLPQWFGLLPDQDVAVKAVPAHLAASTSGAFYDAPSQDGSRLGTYWISLNDTSALPSYSLQTLTYHEANPGHHLQTIVGLSDDLPILNTIFYSNAAGEGWALYAERLAAEMGIYENDPIDDIGRLQSEMHRAVRLVVDSGMHGLGWSREKAIDYSIKTEGIHISEATSEVERYTVWPGQALGYKLGELKIVELRAKAKAALGDKFDIKAFHDQIIEDGALPLNLMEEKINQWLLKQSDE
ncbi:DUF885 domain-containing protein [Thalassotalea atypica]|uniref:DUF885 domain-containing protein n=1 Tax=Thalassotalea atypica TaxID=2054316 RepID=UPI00257292A7|nr:DUF885 domain-containing protein [Thalassotalea atypica]